MPECVKMATKGTIPAIYPTIKPPVTFFRVILIITLILTCTMF